MDFDEIVRAARQQGFTIVPTKNQHIRFVPPDPAKRPVTTSGTPSDNRGLQNLISDLRRYSGFIFEKHSKPKGKRPVPPEKHGT